MHNALLGGRRAEKPENLVIYCGNNTAPTFGDLPIMPTRTAKELLQETVDALPPDATVEDAMERLAFVAKIERGLEQLERGDTIPHDEAGQRLGL